MTSRAVFGYASRAAETGCVRAGLLPVASAWIGCRTAAAASCPRMHAHPSCSGEEVSLIGDAWRILHELATDARWQDVQIAYVSRTDEPRECVAVVGGLGAETNTLCRCRRWCGELAPPAVRQTQRRLSTAVVWVSATACFAAAQIQRCPSTTLLLLPEWASQCLRMLALDNGLTLHDLAHHHEASGAGGSWRRLIAMGLRFEVKLQWRSGCLPPASIQSPWHHCSCPRGDASLFNQPSSLPTLPTTCPTDLPRQQAHALPAHPRADRHPL